MKTKYLLITVLVVVFQLICLRDLYATCKTFDLDDPYSDSWNDVVTVGDETNLEALFNHYTQYVSAVNGVYEVCFTGTYRVTRSLNIDGTAPLLISGLNVTKWFSSNDPVVNISGGDVTLQGALISGVTPGAGIAGNNTGVGVLVTGSNHSIIGSTIQGFTNAIFVAKDTTVQLGENLYKGIEVDKILSGFSVSPIISEFVGKHISDKDAAKADYVVGKLNFTADKCKGTVEVYELSDALSAQINAIVSCNVVPAEKNYCLVVPGHESEMKDVACTQDVATAKGLKIILKDECSFKCDLSDDLSKSVIIAHTQNNVTSDFVYFTDPVSQAFIPIKILVELPSVISVMGPVDIPAPKTGMDDQTTDGGVISLPITIPGAKNGMEGACEGEGCSFIDQGGDNSGASTKGQTTTGDGSDGSGAVAQGASSGGGCGKSSIMDSNGTSSAAIMLMLLAMAGLPIVAYRRIKRK